MRLAFSLIFFLFTLPVVFATSNISFNFSDQENTVGDDFYGLNIQVWDGNFTRLDCNNDGNEDAANCSNNVSEARALVQEMGATVMRRDMSLSDNTDSSDNFINTTSNYADIDVPITQSQYWRLNFLDVLWMSGFMPRHLANNSANCSSQNTTCPPLNVTRYADLTIKFLNITGTCNYSGTRVTTWNEVDLPQFYRRDLANTVLNAIERSRTYVPYHDAMYDAIKAACPQVQVGILAISTVDDASSRALLESVIGNTSKYDYIELHTYYWNIFDAGRGGTGGYDGQIMNNTRQIRAVETQFGRSRKPIVAGETNIYNATHLRNDSRAQYSQVMIGSGQFLLQEGSDGVWVPYVATALSNYSVGFGEQGRDMTMWYSSVLTGTGQPERRAFFNASRDLQRSCPPGSSVMNWTSSNASLYGIACQRGRDARFIVVNPNSAAAVANVTVTGFSIGSAVNYYNGTVYTPVNGRFSFALGANETIIVNMTQNATGNVLLTGGRPLIAGGRPIMVR